MSSPIDLSPVVRAVEQSARDVVYTLGLQIDGVETQVGTIRGDLSLARTELKELREEFQAFVDEAARVATVQQSQTKMVDLKAQLDREFGHYSIVRRTSVGLLQGFDVGNVSNAVATTVAEELMIQTPRYWLAPALVALAAWSHDRPDIAEKSVREAYARDRHKTSLFFTLVLRRQGRLAGSVKWLRHYVASLDPKNLTREFAVILEASSSNAFGPQGSQLISQKLTEWSRELRSSEEVNEEQIKRWQAEIKDHEQQLAQHDYQNIGKLCPQWGTLTFLMESASALPATLEKYRAVHDFEASVPASLEDLLDDILDALVSEFDEEELPLRREVVYHEAIIEERGDIDRAKQKADLLLEALEETNDVVTLQTMGAISPELLGVSVQTQKMAVGVSQDDFRTAVGRHCANYRAQDPTVVELNFDSDHSNHASMHIFVGVKAVANEGQTAIEGKLREAWDKTMAPMIAAAQFDESFFVKGYLLSGGIGFVLFFVNWIIGLLVGGIAALIVWRKGTDKKAAAAQQIAALEQARQDGYEYSVQMYRNAMAELTDANLVYRELDSYEAQLLELINDWPTAKKEN